MSFTTTFRTIRRGDGSALWQLVQSTGALELNSSYFYLVFAEYFADTCLIAERDGEAIGAVIAFRPVNRREALFVWQIGVRPDARRQGLGKRMLQELLLQPGCTGVRYLLATVAPSNSASQRMFGSFARGLNLPLEMAEFFTPELFPDSHEAEELFSIGPLPANPQDLQGANNDNDFTVSRKELDDDRPERRESDENHESAAQEYASNH